MTFGAWLKAKMQEQGLTQQKLADEIGATQQTVSKYVSRDQIPDAAYLMPMANALGVTIFDLLDAIAGGSRSREQRAADVATALEFLREELRLLQQEISDEEKRSPSGPGGGRAGRRNSR